MTTKTTLRKSLAIVLAFFCAVAVSIVMILQKQTAKATESDFTWEIGTTYDADDTKFAESAADETIGEFTSLPILPGNIDNFGITKWADYSNAAFAVGNYGKFRLLTAMDVATIKSVSLKILYPAAACFYVYPLNATSLVYENAKQSFRTTGGLQTITLSTELLAAGGQFGGFILQMVEGTGAQFFVDDITPLAATYTPDTVEEIEKFAWEIGTKYDADGTVFGVSVAGETLGDFTSLAVVSANLSGLGLEQYGTYTGAFANDSYAKFKLQNAMDVATVKSVTITVFRNTADLFNVYPLNASALVNDNVKQSFRTDGELTPKTITLSTELLAVGGQFGGFILQLADGAVGQQLFVDDITPLAQPYTPEPEEPVFAWKTGTKYDADNTVFAESAAGETIGEFTSLRMLPVNFGTSIPGLTQWANYSVSDFGKGIFGKIVLQNAMDVTAIKSVSLTVMHNKAALFYVYPLNATSLVYENAKQSFRVNGQSTITLSTESLAAGGQFGGFILQMIDGDGTNFFLDDITPLAATHTPDTVEKIEEFAWETGVKYDADGTVFGASAAGEKIGDFTSLAVYRENLDSFGLTQWATFTGNFTNDGYAIFRLQTAMDVATIKSVSLTIMRNTADLFYVYPLNASALDVDGAVQSFRTTGGLQTITLSTVALAVDGRFGGFILQMVDGADEQQFFVDDVTPKTEYFIPEDVEQLPVITAGSFKISQDGDDYKINLLFNKRGKFDGDEIPDTSKVYINGVSIDEINADGNYATAAWNMVDGNYRISVVLSKSYTGAGAIKNADNDFLFNNMTVAAGLEFPNGDSLDRTYTCRIYKDERILDYELIKEYEPVKVVGFIAEKLPNSADNISFKIRFDKKISTKGYYHASQTEAWRELNLIVFQDMYDKEVSAAFVAGGFKSALFDCIYINGVSLAELTVNDSWITAVFVNYGQTDAYTLDISFDSKSETYSAIRALIENGDGVTVEIKSGLKFTTGCKVTENREFKIVNYAVTEENQPLRDFKVYYGGNAVESGAVVVTFKAPSESNVYVDGVDDYEITSSDADGKTRFTITLADGREFVFDVDFQPVEVEQPEQPEQPESSGCSSSVGTETLTVLAVLSVAAFVMWRKRYE